MLFNFYIETKHFITKQSKFFKKMNYFIKILYPNTFLDSRASNSRCITSFQQLCFMASLKDLGYWIEEIL